ncbi:B box and SPRY domain-containing protein [Cyprinodon tularosa]|uniref:B box and SPRY domain-containing protein n=1 Tax=Cyprinodon tularosa TaxID=77115 RepID=UPI0018E1FB03|nr:B box and SPRY domain-containing protein [Cyprinodon tularosa]
MAKQWFSCPQLFFKVRHEDATLLCAERFSRQQSLSLPGSAHLLHLCYSAVPQRRDSAGAHLFSSCAMTEGFTECDLTCSSPTPSVETLNAVNHLKLEPEQPIFSVLTGGMKEQERGEAHIAVSHPTTCGATSPTAASDTESGVFSVESELCAEHDFELDWFCGTEQKLICSRCATAGPCREHSVAPLARRVTAVRNQLVDVCEKIQLQALRIEKFIKQTLDAKEQKLQASASRAREQVLAQVSAAREALEEEEQRLLEQVQREAERVEQCLLTQRAHWNNALTSLSQTRSHLVHTLTHAADAQLVTSIQEISERAEEAEGVGDPCDNNQLNLNPACTDSKLLRGLWATALLLGPNAYGSPLLKFDERTVSPLLSLSEDLRTLTFISKKPRQAPPYDPARFDSWPNALGSLSMSSGTHCWVVDVGESGAFKVGVCYANLERKGSGNEARLGHNSQSWVLSHYDLDYSFCHAGKKVPLTLIKRPQRIGLLLDWLSQTLLFYEPDSGTVLYSVTHPFSAPLLPAFAVTDRSITILHR